MPKLLITLFSFLLLQQAIAQNLHFDSSGKVISVNTLTSAKGKITVEGEPFHYSSLISELQKKFKKTYTSFSSKDSALHKFYAALWTEDEMIAVEKDLKEVIAQLDAPEQDKISNSNTFKIKPLFNQILKDPLSCYTLNNTPYSRTYSGKDYLANKHIHLFTIYYRDPFKGFINDRFNDAYARTEMDNLRNTANTSFRSTWAPQWKALKERTQALCSIKFIDIKPANLVDMQNLHKNLFDSKLTKALKNAAYFKELLWYRSGEPTINPFEIRQQDSPKAPIPPAAIDPSKNESLVTQFKQSNYTLNTVLIPDKTKDTRNLYYTARASGDWPDQSGELETALTPSENILVSVYNLQASETIKLKLNEKIAIPDESEAMSSVAEAAKQTGTLVKLINPTIASWSKIVAVFDDLEFPGVADSLVTTPLTLQEIRNSVKDFIKKEGKFNTYYFNEAIQQTPVDATDLSMYKTTLENAYKARYVTIAEAYNTLRTDSLVSEVGYLSILQSNLPPERIQEDTVQQGYHTEFKYTDKINESVKQTYQIDKYGKKENGVKDTATIAVFSYKSGKRYRFLTSAGISFTIPTDQYAVNTVTQSSNTAYTVDTKRPVVKMIAGLHIYLSPIFLQDNHFLYPKKDPWYSRWSVFLGLGITDPLKNYYPGLSCDLLPGIKFIFGPHFYLHEGYKLANNILIKQTSYIRLAGGYMSLNIDPTSLFTALGLK
jgi:hypothetical protein